MTWHRCPCGVAPDPGVCPVIHDGYDPVGHCRCAHDLLGDLAAMEMTQ